MNKILIVAILAIAATVNALPSNEVLKIRGGARDLEGDDLKDAEGTLISSLEKLSAGEEGPHYKLGKINSATKQLVSGSLYKINADIIDDEEYTKNCNIKIWSQPWLDDGVEVTFDCEGDEVLVRKHSP